MNGALTAGLKRAQWDRFVRRSRLVDGAPGLAEVVGELREFLLAPLAAAQEGVHFAQRWVPGKGWRARG